MPDRAAYHLLDVDVVAGGHLAEDEHQPRGGGHLDRHAGVRIVGDDVIQDCVGDLVAELVGMSFGDRFGGVEDRSIAGRTHRGRHLVGSIDRSGVSLASADVPHHNPYTAAS